MTKVLITTTYRAAITHGVGVSVSTVLVEASGYEHANRIVNQVNEAEKPFNVQQWAIVLG